MLYDDSNVCIMFSSKFIIFLNKTISSEFFFLLHFQHQRYHLLEYVLECPIIDVQ